MFDWYLKEWLKSLETSQAELSRLTDYPKAKVSDLVTGKQRYNRDILNDIAKALNIAPHELLMHPDEANAIKRLRLAMDDMVKIPIGGSTTDEAAERRKTA